MSKRGAYKKSRIQRLTTNKKTTIPKIQTAKSQKSQLFKETLKLVKQANSRLTKLRQSGYDTGTWSSKKLNARLQTNKIGAWHRGRIKVNENMTDTQLKAIQKASSQFLSSKTSTPKGIGQVKKKTLESLKQTLATEDKGKLTTEDAEFYYDMLGTDDFDNFSDKIGASTLWIQIDEAIEQGDSEESWISRLSRYTEINDEDTRDRAIRLYNKYIL